MKNSVVFLICLFLWVSNPDQLVAQQALIDSLQNIISKNNQDTLHLKALVNLGIALERTNLQQSKANFLAALAMKNNPDFNRLKATAAIRLAGNYSATGSLDSANYYFEKAESIIKSYPSDHKLAYNLYSGLGIHFNRIGKADLALDNYKKASVLDPSLIGLDNVAGLYINMANVYQSLDDQKLRVESAYKALEIFEKTQNKTGLSFVYNLLGSINYQLKNYSESEKYFLSSLEYRKLLNDRRGEAVVLSNIGNIYTDRGSYDQAIEFFIQASEINESLGLKDQKGIALINLGKTYEKMGDYQKALGQFKEAQKILNEAGISKMDALLLTDIGKVQRMLSMDQESYANLLKSSQLAESEKQYFDAITAFKNLKEYYQEKGRYQEALMAQTKEYTYRDSVGMEALRAQLKEFESKYALDLKENEINLLKAEKELDKLELSRRKANQNLIMAIFFFLILLAGILVNKYRIVGKTKRLLEVERLRNAIARDLHDDLGSTLSSIHILSQMALQRETNGSNPVFSKINTQTATMMDKLSDIVWSIHPDNDNLDQLLSKMQEFAAEMLEPKEITYEFEVSEGAKEIKLDLEKRRNLFLIFKEALNNAAKYADSQHLDIRLTVQGGKLNLLIKDDGKGFDQTLIKKGNGLFNMQQRAQMMGGNMVIESFPEMGTSIQLSAPIA
ncbi:tetratricopeptide repeat-containing sensor histidine kinase [Mongoliitalea daihaiensis]|uniref:tetratricopeptide repeat-containing sensor histidine kinase n=1 Tax=Mongoliitalea daihaiensis TaxID=2782006 RepID=UPI001F3C783B|nr:tetratricopeptide repeat-containing sensor histidine kinase [Mongoliitalea daihaiensis]UJP63619.1 tetratricopeptide repeat protein [Mongoliitalea daihaiensis]